MRTGRPELTDTAPATRDRLHAHWADLNARYFGGALPPIEIVWSSRLTPSAGLFVSHTRPR